VSASGSIVQWSASPGILSIDQSGIVLEKDFDFFRITLPHGLMNILEVNGCGHE